MSRKYRQRFLNKSPKPILVIRVTFEFDMSTQHRIRKALKDYYIIFIQGDYDDFSFECINAPKYKTKSLESIKEALDSFKKIN